jgi:hypothetical protein
VHACTTFALTSSANGSESGQHVCNLKTINSVAKPRTGINCYFQNCTEPLPKFGQSALSILGLNDLRYNNWFRIFMSQVQEILPRRTAPAARITPTHYLVSRANSTISLPTTQPRKRVTFSRLKSFKRPVGTLYLFESDASVPDLERWCRVGNTDHFSPYAVTFRPKNSDKQQLVALSSFEVTDEGW